MVISSFEESFHITVSDTRDTLKFVILSYFIIRTFKFIEFSLNTRDGCPEINELILNNSVTCV